ncbi:MAG: hypothetical protein ACREAY_04435, partial [Nitrososphaera sp.]
MDVEANLHRLSPGARTMSLNLSSISSSALRTHSASYGDKPSSTTPYKRGGVNKYMNIAQSENESV